MADQTGTIQICSGLAVQVPALAKQLSDAVKLLGDQQRQIRELTRLTRALNDSIAGLDDARQAKLLKALSAQLSSSERLGTDGQRRTIEELGDRLDDLREALLKSRSIPESDKLTRVAMTGSLGDAIANLDWTGTQRHFAEMDVRLRQIQTDLSDVKGGVSEVNRKLDRLAASAPSQNPFDNCGDLMCALSGGASMQGLQRMIIDKGVRVFDIPMRDGSLVMSALARPANERLSVLSLLLRAGLDPQIRFDPSATKTTILTQAGEALANLVMDRNGARSKAPTDLFGPRLGLWNEMARCLNKANQGVLVTEVLALLGHEDLLQQASELGFAKPRPQLVCRDVVLGRTISELSLSIGPGAAARIANE